MLATGNNNPYKEEVVTMKTMCMPSYFSIIIMAKHEWAVCYCCQLMLRNFVFCQHCTNSQFY